MSDGPRLRGAEGHGESLRPRPLRRVVNRMNSDSSLQPPNGMVEDRCESHPHKVRDEQSAAETTPPADQPGGDDCHCRLTFSDLPPIRPDMWLGAESGYRLRAPPPGNAIIERKPRPARVRFSELSGIAQAP